ncbi:Uncharacterised protein [Segatella copri]|nr:Uncharacterised protein [Segatella copri]
MRMEGAAPGSPLVCCRVIPEDKPERLWVMLDVGISAIFEPFTVDMEVDTERLVIAP